MKNRGDKVRNRTQLTQSYSIMINEIKSGLQTLKSPVKDIALIMTLCTSLFGIFMLSHGFIRDYISNGVARIEMYFLLSFGSN